MFIFLIILIFSINGKFLFISPNFTDCSDNFCDGSLNNPYNNFFDALGSIIDDDESYSLIFMGNSNNEHYLLRKEKNTTEIIYPDTFQYEDLYNISIELKPLYCDDPDFSSLIYANYCQNSAQTPYIKLILKDYDFQIKISTNLTIKNIYFDGLDALLPESSNDSCRFERKRCCETNFSFCTQGFSDLESITPSIDSLFQLIGGARNQTWSIYNSTFKNLISVKHKSLFATDKPANCSSSHFFHIPLKC